MINSTKAKQFLLSLLIVLITCASFTRSEAQLSGYVFTQTTSAYTAITPTTILGTATAGGSGATALDDIVYNLPASPAIPFTFKFNYINVTQLYVSTNGFVTFGTTAPAATGLSTGYTPISAVTAYDGCASAIANNLAGNTVAGTLGELSYTTIGTTPSRKFVIQYKNWKRTTANIIMNFQIRLCETTNIIEFSYGTFTTTAGAGTGQVGVRGSSNTIFLNRTVASGGNWANSGTGIANNDICNYTSGLIPSSNLVYQFGPTACPAPINLAATNVTTTSADLTWSVISGGGTFNVEYGLSGFTPGTGITVSNIVANTLSIGGLTPATNYQFYVKQNCSASGNGFSASSVKNFSSGTPGEDCASAPTVNVAANLGACAYTVINSGVSQNGPLSQCSDATGNLPNDDRWVKFVAPANGKKLIITTTAGTVNDWVMELWNGCPTSGGTVVQSVGCGDDQNGFMPEISVCQNLYVAGQTYYLRMWTYSQTLTGNMNLCVYETTECAIPPSNDECAFGTRLTINNPGACPTSAVTLTTKYATVTGEPTSCGTASNIHDIWMVFNTGLYGDFNLNFALGTATSLHASIVFECGGGEITCFSTAAGNHLITGLNPNADYILRVWSDTTGWGTFSVCMSYACIQPTANLSGSSVICAGDTAHVPITLTGIGPWTFVYSNGTSTQSVTTSSSTYVIDTAPNATTFYTLVSVTTGGGICVGNVSGNYLVNVVPKPVINNFTPASASVGTVLTVNGTNFNNSNMFGFNGVYGAGFTIVNNNQITVTVPGGATSGLLSVKNIGCTAKSTSVFTVTANNVTVNLKMFLEGYYNQGVMSAVLDPANKPTVCDSVYLSLYNSTSPYTFAYKAGAELSIVGNASFVFPASVVGFPYYLAVTHQNSIETWSKVPVYLPSTGLFYDFSH